MLEALIAALEDMTAWEASALEETFRRVADQHDVKLGKLAQPVRVAVTGSKKSPGIFEVLEVVGREWSLSRLRVGIEKCRASSPAA